MTSKTSGPTKSKVPRGRAGNKPPAAGETHQATTEDLQREGLGVAAKE